MQIGNNQIPAIHTTQGARPERAAASPRERQAAETKTDEVALSDAARALPQVEQAAKESPDVRADRVKELHQAVRNGTYRVDARAIAEKLLEHGL